MNLTVKPKHLVEESLIGYLLRLASRNGFLYVQDMVEARFVDAAVKNNFLKVQNSLPLIAFREGNLFQSTSNALWKNVRYIHPKVCIACLEQLGLIREEHLQGNTHYCAHHSKPLVTSCMSCGHTLKWDVDLIDARCTNPSCGCKLKPVDVPYKLSSDQVLDCLVANQFIKGQITTYVKQKAFIDTQNFPQAVADGLAFLNNEKVIFDWCHNQWQHSPHILPANLRFHSFTLLKSMLLSKWVGIESLSRDKYNSPADFQVGHLKHYLNVDWATRLLHMNQDELSIIKDLGLIETLTKNRLSAGSVINVMPLFEMLVNQSKEKLLSLKPLSHMKR
ncbi:hypothetical protein NCCP2140_24360 [Pseudoalteromonas sp. NCCP-2140]|uniref:hypothetical protein n=1 Tax=Pseudoalteromonas sp. NCCP-2140 TaxID=2942288 RepID=UPI00203C38F4|nr:hypothetical protein [Pseudoalteromonas sp. NCCP-2140]GKW53383.1 hypothetical protein NCCP2140_24360 [Pseudoalteromonas sp. NCCP-2140]